MNSSLWLMLLIHVLKLKEEEGGILLDLNLQGTAYFME